MEQHRHPCVASRRLPWLDLGLLFAPRLAGKEAPFFPKRRHPRRALVCTSESLLKLPQARQSTLGTLSAGSCPLPGSRPPASSRAPGPPPCPEGKASPVRLSARFWNQDGWRQLVRLMSLLNGRGAAVLRLTEASAF